MTYEEYCEMTDMLQSYINDECITMEAACELNNIFYESYVNTIESSNFDKWIDAKANAAEKEERIANAFRKGGYVDKANEHDAKAKKNGRLDDLGGIQAKYVKHQKNEGKVRNLARNEKTELHNLRSVYKNVYGGDDKISPEKRYKKNRILDIQNAKRS